MSGEKLLAPFKRHYDDYSKVAAQMGKTFMEVMTMQQEINEASLRQIIESDETTEEKAFALECWTSGFYNWQVAMVIHQAMGESDE